MRTGLLLALAACSSSKYEPPPEPPPPSPMDQVRQYLAADPPDVLMVASALKDAGSAAPQATDALLAAWPRIETQELVLAKRAGTERAQGKSRDNCRECTIFGEEMDALAPRDAKLAAAWSALKPKLTAAEDAAYQTEAADKRPRVIVWADASRDSSGAGAVMVADCVHDALQTAYPDYKWLMEWQRPERDAASIEVVASVATDDYKDSRTGKHAVSLASGMKLALVPHALPRGVPLSAFEVAASVQSPDEIKSDLNVTPTLEASRAGMDQLDQLRTRVCAKVTDALKDQHAKR